MTIRAEQGIFWIYGFLLCLLPVIAVFSVNAYGSMPMVMFPLAVALLWREKQEHPHVDKPLLAFTLALPLLALASSHWAQDPAAVFDKLPKTLMIYISGFGLYTLAQRQDGATREKICRYFLIAFAAAALLLIEELLLHHPLYHLVKGIPFDKKVLSSIVNHGAVVLSLLFWPFLYLKIKAQKTALGAAVGICFFIILALFGKSETALASFAAGAVVFTCAFYLPRLTFWAALVTTMLIALLAPWIYPLAFGYFAEPLSAWQSASAGERLDIWNAVALYALDRPLQGFGMEASRHIKDFNFSGLYNKRNFIIHPHNNILQLWIEFGVTGALWAAGFLALVLCRLRKLAGLEYAISMACFAACFTVALVGYGLWQSWWPGAVFLTAATLRIAFPVTK